MAAIALGYLTGRALRWRPPAFLFVAVVVTLVFFVAAEAAGVVLSNVGAFLAISMLYSLSLILATGPWALSLTSRQPPAKSVSL